MKFSQTVRLGFSKIFTIKGRASRSEFWCFFLVTSLLMILSSLLMILSSVLWLITFEAFKAFKALPHSLAYYEYIGISFSVIAIGYMSFLFMFSITVRRYHDSGRSGYLLFITMIPFIGFLIWLYYMIKKGDAEDNRYGSPVVGKDRTSEMMDW